MNIETNTGESPFVLHNPNILTITPSGKCEVIRIDPEGRLFWNGREVETDDDFRAAMLDLAKYLRGER